MKNNNQKQYNKSVYMYINPLQNYLTQFVCFFFFFFFNVYSLTFKGPQTTTLIQCRGTIHPTVRYKSRSAISTQLHIFIFTYTCTKKTKVKQFILSKVKSKSQDSQHKSDYEREREREYHFIKRNDMSITFLQQILSGRLLLVVIVGAKK